MSDQWYSNFSGTADKPSPKQALTIRQSFVAYASIASLTIAVLVILWAFIAVMDWPDKNLDKPDWDGQYGSEAYELSDFLPSAGLDVSKNFPLDFNPVNSLKSEKPTFSLLDTNDKTMRFSLQWRGNGYIVDVPLRIVAIRLDDANTIKVHMGSSNETFESTNRLVAIQRPRTLANIFFFHYWRKEVKPIPITSTPTWKKIRRLGVGEFFWENRGSIDSIVITLTPQAYEQYAARLPLSG